jgi:hypothetical protein
MNCRPPEIDHDATGTAGLGVDKLALQQRRRSQVELAVERQHQGIVEVLASDHQLTGYHRLAHRASAPGFRVRRRLQRSVM